MTDENYPIPYRPSANGRCPITSEGVVGWSSEPFSGKAFKVKFTLNPLIKLPAKAIVSVAYDTTNYGYGTHAATDIGEDSLNVAVSEASPTKGMSPLQATGEARRELGIQRNVRESLRQSGQIRPRERMGKIPADIPDHPQRPVDVKGGSPLDALLDRQRHRLSRPTTRARP